VAPRLLFVPWYRDRTSKRLGVAIAEPRQGHFPVNELVRQLLASGHRVAFAGFVAKGLDDGVVSYPLGTVVLVVPLGGSVPAPDLLEVMTLAVYSRFVFERIPPDSPHARGAKLQEDYATPWLSLADAFDRNGQGERAEACRRR